MRIGLVSDSHGRLDCLETAVSQMGNVDVILHMGDCIDDARQIRSWTNAPVFMVKGNMDVYEEGHLQIKTELGGKSVMICHGHRYNVKGGYQTLRYKALEEGVDIVAFGHTHVPMIDQSPELLMINPGSVALPHIGGEKTFGIVTIEGDEISAEIKPLQF